MGLGGSITAYTDPSVRYEISAPDSQTFRIRVRESIWELVAVSLRGELHGVFRHWLGRLGPGYKFVSPMEVGQAWGFGAVLDEMERRNGWVEWKCALSSESDGTAKSPFWGGTTDRLRAVVATLNVLFYLLNADRAVKDGSLGSPQLLEVWVSQVSDIMADRYPIQASFTSALVQWLVSRTDEQSARLSDELTKLMRETYRFIQGSPGVSNHFSVEVRPMKYRFSLQVYGDACALIGCSHEAMQGGIHFDRHNCDHVSQQFAILMALARLHDLVRADQAQILPTP